MKWVPLLLSLLTNKKTEAQKGQAIAPKVRLLIHGSPKTSTCVHSLCSIASRYAKTHIIKHQVLNAL